MVELFFYCRLYHCTGHYATQCRIFLSYSYLNFKSTERQRLEIRAKVVFPFILDTEFYSTANTSSFFYDFVYFSRKKIIYWLSINRLWVIEVIKTLYTIGNKIHFMHIFRLTNMYFRFKKVLIFGCHIDTNRCAMVDGTEHLISCHWLAFPSAFSHLQLIQN